MSEGLEKIWKSESSAKIIIFFHLRVGDTVSRAAVQGHSLIESEVPVIELVAFESQMPRLSKSHAVI